MPLSEEAFRRFREYQGGGQAAMSTQAPASPQELGPAAQEQQRLIDEQRALREMDAVRAEMHRQNVEAAEDAMLPDLPQYDPRTSELTRVARHAGFVKGLIGDGEGGEGKKKLSATERTDMFSYMDQINMLDDIKVELEAGKYDSGLGGGILTRGWVGAKSLAGVGDPANEKFRELTMRMQQAISGQQMTHQEREFMQQFMPRVGDNEETVLRRVQQARKTMEDRLESRGRIYKQSGYDVPDFREEMKKARDSGVISVDY